MNRVSSRNLKYFFSFLVSKKKETETQQERVETESSTANDLMLHREMIGKSIEKILLRVST